MILRQVDDFSVSATDQTVCQDIIAQIGSHLTVPLNDLGIIRKFKGVNVHQTKWYIKISCEDYLMKILMHHEWLQLKASNLPIPMRSDSKYQRELETAERPKHRMTNTTSNSRQDSHIAWRLESSSMP